jgi:hypothetical protein
MKSFSVLLLMRRCVHRSERGRKPLWFKTGVLFVCVCVCVSERVSASIVYPTQASMWKKASNQYNCEFQLSKPTHFSGTSVPVEPNLLTKLGLLHRVTVTVPNLPTHKRPQMLHAWLSTKVIFFLFSANCP